MIELSGGRVHRQGARRYIRAVIHDEIVCTVYRPTFDLAKRGEYVSAVYVCEGFNYDQHTYRDGWQGDLYLESTYPSFSDRFDLAMCRYHQWRSNA